MQTMLSHMTTHHRRAFRQEWHRRLPMSTRTLAGPFLLALIAAAAVTVTSVRPAAADEVRPAEGQDDSQQLLADRSAIRQLELLEQQMASGQLNDVRDKLKRLTQGNPAWMIPGPADTWEPLYRRLFRSFHQLSPDLQQALRDEDQALADTELQQALKSGSPEALVLLIQRFPGSTASCRAHLILAQQHLNRGQRLAAIQWLQPLAEPGVPKSFRSKALALLRHLLPDEGAGAAAKPDEAVPIRNPPEAAAQIDELLPQHVHWQHTPALPPAIALQTDRLISSAQQVQEIPWTNWAPVVDAQHVFVRTLRGVMAVGRRDGTTHWMWSSSQNLETSLGGQGRPAEDEDDSAPPGAAPDAVFSSLERSPVCNLLNRNGVAGRLTADDQRIFLINDPQLLQNASTFPPFMSRTQPAQQVPATQIIALDKQTGRRLWTSGGEPVEQQFGNDMSLAWIAGAPTVAGRALYSVIEQRDTIFLTCLSAETGRLDWKVPLTFPGTPISRDPARRLQSAVPTVREGLIWTTTTTGWLMGVDSLTRTMIWAHRTQTGKSAEEPRAGRGRIFAVTPAASLRFSWQNHAPVAVGTSLIVFPSDSQDVLILNSLTGQSVQRLPAGEHVLPLHVDEQRIVLAGSRSLESRSLRDGSTLWKKPFADSDFRPTGQAIRKQGALLVSLSDGSLAAIDLLTGDIRSVRRGLRAGPVWGGLFEAGADVLACSPRQLVLLSSSPSSRSSLELPERAEVLLSQGRVTEALALLSETPHKALEEDRIRRLRVRALVAVAELQNEQSAEALKQLPSLIRSPAERAEFTQLQVLQLIHDQQLPAAIRLLAESLKKNDGTLEQAVPFRFTPGAGAERTTTSPPPLKTGRLQYPLRSWIQVQLSQLLSHVGGESQANRPIDPMQLSDEHLLEIALPALQPELLRRADDRIQRGELNEQTLHMLVQAWEYSRSVVDHRPTGLAEPEAVTERVRRFRDRLAGQSDANAPWTAIRLRLLDTLLASELSSVDDDFTSNPDPDPEAASVWHALHEQWQAWPDVPYSVIPVTQSVSLRQTDQPLIQRFEDDPFLSAYEWQIHRNTMVLRARDILSAKPRIWTVSGSFPSGGTFGNLWDSIGRCGSVITSQTTHSLSGFSAFDQRSLWNRRFFEATVSSTLLERAPDRRVTDYRVDLRSGTSAFFPLHYQICGTSPRWVCLQSQTRLEMIDSLTGHTRWSLEGAFQQAWSFATADMVLQVCLDSGIVQALHTTDGTPLATHVTDQDLKHALMATERELVVLRPRSVPTDPLVIDWLDPKTAEVSRSVRLAGILHSQFLDARTLICVAEDRFHVVSLESGRVREYTLTHSATSTATRDSGSPRQWTVCADPLNFYVFVAGITNPVMQSRVFGRELTPINGELQAIDRRSGQLAWRVDAGSAMTATFDQPLSPVLLLIHSDAPRDGNLQGLFGQQGASVMTFRGLLKTSGTQLFFHRHSSRFPVPFVRLLTNAAHHIDVEAFGSRIRFLPQQPAER